VPARTSSIRPASAAVRAIGPYSDIPNQCSSTPPASGTTPGPGLRPTSPQQADGTRIEPPPSEPSASAAIPAATAAAPPPVEPPVVIPGWRGFCGVGNASGSVNGPIASSGSCDLPLTTQPAARRRRTSSSSCVAGSSEVAAAPWRAGRPATSTLSLTATGTPARGSEGSAAVASASASSRGRSDWNACSVGSSSSMRARHSLVVGSPGMVGYSHGASDGPQRGRRAAPARRAAGPRACGGAGPAPRLGMRRLPHRPPRRRRRAAASQAPVDPRPPDRRPDGGRAPARRAVARLDGRHLPLLRLRPREPLRVGALHRLRPRRRLRGVRRRGRAVLSPGSRRVRRRRGGAAPLCGTDRLPLAPPRRRRRAARPLRLRQLGAHRRPGRAPPGAPAVRLRPPRRRGGARVRARARLRVGRRVGREAAGGARRGDRLRAAWRARPRGARRTRARRRGRLRGHPHERRPELPVRAALGGALHPVGGQSHPAGRGGVPRARASGSRPDGRRDVPARAGERSSGSPAARPVTGVRRANTRYVSRFRTIAGWANAHRRLLGIAQIVLLVVFFGSLGWALRGSLHSAAHDLDHANLVLFGLGCAALGAYYLVFVLGWMRILAEWGIELSYPAALRAEMISMLAKYVPGGIWTPAARVVAARRAGITDAALVTSSMLLEAGISAVAGVIVFVLSLPFVDEVNAPLAPLVVFGAVLAILVQPRVFRPLAGKVLRRLGYTKELPNLRGRTL